MRPAQKFRDRQTFVREDEQSWFHRWSRLMSPSIEKRERIWFIYLSYTNVAHVSTLLRLHVISRYWSLSQHMHTHTHTRDNNEGRKTWKLLRGELPSQQQLPYFSLSKSNKKQQREKWNSCSTLDPSTFAGKTIIIEGLHKRKLS